MSILPLLFNTILEVPARAIRLENEEVKLFVFSDDMIMYIENPKESSQKLLEILNKFSKFIGNTMNIQKSILFLYTDSEQSENWIKETVPFAVTLRRTNVLFI